MQLGFCYSKQQIPLKRFLCLRKGGGSGGPQEPNQPHRHVQGKGALSPPAPHRPPPLHRGPACLRGEAGRAGAGQEGRRRFHTGAISHSGGPHLPGSRRQRKEGRSGRACDPSATSWASAGAEGIRLRPGRHLPARPGCPSPADPAAHRGAGRPQEEVTSGPEAAQLGWQHFLSPGSRTWGSRHILYSSEAALGQAEPNRPLTPTEIRRQRHAGRERGRCAAVPG